MLHRNGEMVAEGRSDAVLGNPVTAVAWLADKVAGFGVTLEAGHVILPGSVHRAIDVRPGDDFVAEFDGLRLRPAELHLTTGGRVERTSREQLETTGRGER